MVLFAVDMPTSRHGFPWSQQHFCAIFAASIAPDIAHAAGGFSTHHLNSDCGRLSCVAGPSPLCRAGPVACGCVRVISYVCIHRHTYIHMYMQIHIYVHIDTYIQVRPCMPALSARRYAAFLTLG